jgi:hypothetical protein
MIFSDWCRTVCDQDRGGPEINPDTFFSAIEGYVAFRNGVTVEA